VHHLQLDAPVHSKFTPATVAKDATAVWSTPAGLAHVRNAVDHLLPNLTYFFRDAEDHLGSKYTIVCSGQTIELRSINGDKAALQLRIGHRSRDICAFVPDSKLCAHPTVMTAVQKCLIKCFK
jgi:hypothetical protein